MSARLGLFLTLVPQRRTLAVLVLGAMLVVLIVASPAFIAVAIVYHAALATVLVRDARRLPPARAFAATRQVPEPLSLGEVQEVLLGVSCTAAAGLRASVADHAPIGLSPGAREIEGSFDQDGYLISSYPLRPRRRGAYEFPVLDVRIWRPGGWWLRQFQLPVTTDAAVYPDVMAIRRWQLTLRRGVRALPGQRRARPPGAATDPAGLRDYLPGDDARRINWKATARRDAPITTELEAERGQQLMIALDCGRLMTAPAGHLTKQDHAVNAALLLAWVAQTQGDRVGLMAFADRVGTLLAPRRGLRQVSRLNEVLYRVRAEYAEPEYGEAFAYLARHVRGRSLVVVLTDVLDAEASSDLVAHALRLGVRHRVLVVAMADPELVAALRRPVADARRAYEWAAAEELVGARRRAFETLQRGGVQCLDVEAGRLSPALVERYLELKERGLL
jgi:uncharacterized protein (DUF58 family)